MTRAAIQARFYVPLVVLFLFALGAIASMAALAQEPTATSNAVQISSLEAQVKDLSELTPQITVLRERVIALETVEKDHSRQLDSIADMEKWIVFGVFGTLVTQILGSRVKFNKQEEHQQHQEEQ